MITLSLTRCGFGAAFIPNTLPSSLSIVISSPSFYFRFQTHPELELLFDYIQDDDLWQHKLPKSREFSAGLQSMRLEPDVNINLDLFQQLGALVVGDVCARGVGALQERDALIARLLPAAVPYTIPAGPAGTLVCLALEVDASTAEIRSKELPCALVSAARVPSGSRKVINARRAASRSTVPSGSAEPPAAVASTKCRIAAPA